MKGQEVLFSGAHSSAAREKGSTDNWGTPVAFFNLLNEEFGFTLDPCADASNAKCAYFDEADDGLSQDWGENVCFVNFPYSAAKASAGALENITKANQAKIVAGRDDFELSLKLVTLRMDAPVELGIEETTIGVVS